MVWELRSRGVTVLSTHGPDVVELSDEPTEQLRRVVRTVLSKAEAHLELVADAGPPDQVARAEDETNSLPETVHEIHDDENGVVIELIPPQARDVGDIRPAR